MHMYFLTARQKSGHKLTQDDNSKMIGGLKILRKALSYIQHRRHYVIFLNIRFSVLMLHYIINSQNVYYAAWCQHYVKNCTEL